MAKTFVCGDCGRVFVAQDLSDVYQRSGEYELVCIDCFIGDTFEDSDEE